MLVSDLMRTDLVTCAAAASLRSAVERMLASEVGSVIVTSDGDPVAILTGTDVMRATAETGRPLGDIPVRAAASHPLVTTAPGTTIRRAVETMTDNRVKKLPVVDGMDLVGILTQTDVVAHYGDFVREAHRLDAMADAWEE
ncbi:CBS domain-containing protein [Halobaculum litoreum]|uniref:CBS domain-containing protein n=1 Tax=Halobaculum litoreum TaxID=3031998 RepID=A0ABD5Y059_9EURY